MELENSKPIIISVGIGGWYAKGVARLERNLYFHGFPGDFMGWENTDPTLHVEKSHDAFPYYFKIGAFEAARRAGGTHILWCDASLYPIREVMPLFDFINANGFYVFRTGYNLAQTVNDRTLEALGLSRDDLGDFPEYASGCVGFNFKNDKAKELYSLWKSYMDQGLSRGRREENKIESTDPRFLHHRQDQTCLSLAMYKLGLSINEQDYVAYYNANGTGYDKEKCIFFIQGL